MAEKLTLASMCAGGVQERIDRALAKISDNILDLNTDAKKKRVLLLYGIRCSRGMPFHKRRLRGLLTISRQNCSDTQTLAEQIQRSASIQPRNR